MVRPDTALRVSMQRPSEPKVYIAAKIGRGQALQQTKTTSVFAPGSTQRHRSVVQVAPVSPPGDENEADLSVKPSAILPSRRRQKCSQRNMRFLTLATPLNAWSVWPAVERGAPAPTPASAQQKMTTEAVEQRVLSAAVRRSEKRDARVRLLRQRGPGGPR